MAISNAQIFTRFRETVPAYVLWVHARPTQRGNGRKTYVAALKVAAAKHINSPISTTDVEVEILYSTARGVSVRADIDNVIKPSLDALNGIAYGDDRQVRSVCATLVVRGEQGIVRSSHEQAMRLAMSSAKSLGPDVVMIAIYSDSRLRDLGGSETVLARHTLDAQDWINERLS